MHIAFGVPPYTTIEQVDRIMEEIGNPNMIFHDFYFYGDVEPKYLQQLYDLRDLDKIENVGFLGLRDNPVSGVINDDT